MDYMSLHDELLEEIRSRMIAHIRKECLHLKEVSKRLGVHPNTLSGILFKKKRTHAKTLLCMREYLNEAETSAETSGFRRPLGDGSSVKEERPLITREVEGSNPPCPRKSCREEA